MWETSPDVDGHKALHYLSAVSAREKMNKKIIWENIKSLLIAFILAMFIRTFFFQAFKIPSRSMEPTLQVGDRLLANKIIYRFRKPERGEVIIFKYPENRRRDFVKRLVGLPEEKVGIHNGKVYIDGKEVNPVRNKFLNGVNPLNSRYYYSEGPYGENEVLVPPHFYYVLGDNSRNSKDSRYWGFVPERDIIGKAFFIYWPFRRFGVIK